MASLNRVTLIGNAGADPEMRYTPDGDPVTSFNLAVNTKRGEQESVTWFRIIAWRKLGEIVNQYVSKGSLIFAEGKLMVKEWENKDGAPRVTLEVQADRVVFLDRKDQGGAPESEQVDGQQPVAADPGDLPF